MAGFVIGLPTGGRSQFLRVCDVPLPMGAPDADIRGGPFLRFHSRSSPVFVDFPPGLVYDLQRVGDFVHVLLLAGLALLLLAFLRAREAAIRRATSDTNQTP